MADYEPAPFYAPWPLFGKKFSAQLGEIRANQDALAPIVKSTGYDVTDVADLRGSGVFSREWGEENFHNKFRIRWHKGAEDVEFQCNQGTEAVPNWETYFYIGCESRDVNSEVPFKAYNDFWVTGGFYINGVPFSSAGEANTASNLTGDEGVFSAKSLVDLQFKSLTAGSNITLSSDANAITIASTASGGGGGFYGVIFKETEAGGAVYRDDQLNVDSEFFYLSEGGDGKPILGFLNPAGSGEVNTASNLAGDEGVFASKSGVDLRFKSLTAGSNVTLASDGNAITISSTAAGGGGGFYGVQFKETHATATELSETISFSDNLDGTGALTRTGGGSWIQDGYILGTFVTTSGTKTVNATITAINDAGTTITVNPYPGGSSAGASTVNGTGPGGYEERDDELQFDANLFYMSSSAGGKPIVSGYGINTASNLAGDEGVFGSKKRQDLRFKSLTAGDNITLSSDSNAITITGEVGIEDIGPGFYGFTHKESKSGGPSYTGDVLTVDSNFFYISTGGDGNPILSSIPSAGSGETNTASNLAGDEGVFGSKSGVDLRFKSLTAGTNITLSSDTNAITINSTAAGGGGGGGFYGVIFKETEAGGSIYRDDQLNVDSTYFYLSESNTDGKPILSLAGVPKFFSHAQATAAVEWQVSHGLNTKRLLAQAWDDGNQLVTPDKIDTSDPATAYFYFGAALAGWAQMSGIPDLL